MIGRFRITVEAMFELENGGDRFVKIGELITDRPVETGSVMLGHWGYVRFPEFRVALCDNVYEEFKGNMKDVGE